MADTRGSRIVGTGRLGRRRARAGAALKAELWCSERRREAAEQWADLLEAELEARDERLEAVIAEYERQLKVAERDDPDPAGPPARSTGVGSGGPRVTIR